MRKGKRSRQKTDSAKNPASSPSTSSRQTSPPRLVPGVDYRRMTGPEIRRLSQERLRRWLDPTVPLLSLQNNGEVLREVPRQKLAQRPSRSDYGPSQNDQSTRNYGLPSPLHQAVLDLGLKPDKVSGPVTKAIECLGRKIKRELVFAHGGGGSSRRYPDRKSPSKVKC